MRKRVFVYAVFFMIVFFTGYIYGAIPAKERSALIAFYNSTDGDNWTDNSRWKTPPLHTDGFAMPGTEEKWYGVTVSNNHVLRIEIWGNQLTGSIPPELGNLGKLEYLNLTTDQLNGNIPSELGNLSELQNLQLNGSQLSGSIPSELGSLSKLQYLNLDANNLTGSIPSSLGNLQNLEHLYLCFNQLSGIIPEELGNLRNLNYLYLDLNKLSDSIPEELANLHNLVGLSLRLNKLSGNIPPGLGNLTNLTELILDGNQLSGNIPQGIGNLINLETLYLNDNKLSGEIPKNLINLTKLTYFSISSNCLYTNDPELRAWLDTQSFYWEFYQNECGFTLTVQSSPETGVAVIVSPADSYGQGNGSTEFFRTYDANTVVTLTAPETDNGKLFSKWIIDGTDNGGRTVQITMDIDHTARAVYQSVDYTLTVQSFPFTGIGIAVTPDDSSGNGDGNTNFARTYQSGASVTLTAPTLSNGNDFFRWTVDGNNYTQRTIQVTMNNNHTAVVYYDTPPKISVDRTRLNFGYVTGGSYMPVVRFTISNSGGGTLNWNAGTEMHRVGLNPESGSNSGEVDVSINPVGLPPGNFRGVIYISDSLATNSPVEVEINLWVKSQAESAPPFGEFSTPEAGSTVSSSVPLTGWALGDTGMESVKIYREDDNNLVYIGDAGFVEGARPDIETGYPGYPMNHKAGWGYMMLTHFLPNGGNGTFKIHAVATDKEGRSSTLGVKTIAVDNANAVKPFGAIDTPIPGGTASGNNYRNSGWALTPPPNKIPENGSTINVYVDGEDLGNPVYNVPREDILEYFPGYANSDGAHAYFDFDTTTYENGVHTIYWYVVDNAGNVDGIGSRYFSIQNSGVSAKSTAYSAVRVGQGVINMEHGFYAGIPVDFSGPVKIKKGYHPSIEPETIYPDENGTINIQIKELTRLEIHLKNYHSQVEEKKTNHSSLFTHHPSLITHHSSFYSGYSVVGDLLKPLPIGSTLDTRRGIFYWQPGVGFQGDYEFVFLDTAGNEPKKIKLTVRILPKFQEKR